MLCHSVLGAGQANYVSSCTASYAQVCSLMSRQYSKGFAIEGNRSISCDFSTLVHRHLIMLAVSPIALMNRSNEESLIS
jgi:hypothetical protein